MGLEFVEIILGCEEAFDISLPNEECQSLRTTRLLIDHIYEKVRSPLPEDNGCLTWRAFVRLRRAFAAEGISPRAVRLESKISELLPARQRRDALNAVLARAGLPPRSRLPFGLQFASGDVGDLVADVVVNRAYALRRPNHGWSRGEVREVVRTVMRTKLGLRRFSGDADFVKDLGLG
jgi:hypothetical protein